MAFSIRTRLYLSTSFLGFLIVAVTGAGLRLSAQEATQVKPASDAPRTHWDAQWISHPTAPLRDPLTLHFRKTIELAAVPAHYVVHVSGDNRFVLYLNGRRVGDGPARGDLAHWRYETFDLAPLMRAIPRRRRRRIPMQAGM